MHVLTFWTLQFEDLFFSVNKFWGFNIAKGDGREFVWIFEVVNIYN